MKKLIAILLCVILCLFCASCEQQAQADIWENAKYTQDTSFGDGSKTLIVKVEAMDKAVTFTIKSDSDTVGEALKNHNIIEGEQGPYGLYIKSVNGITADYNIDKSYWSFNKNGEYMMTGVDMTLFLDGDSYELVYIKE